MYFINQKCVILTVAWYNRAVLSEIQSVKWGLDFLDQKLMEKTLHSVHFSKLKQDFLFSLFCALVAHTSQLVWAALHPVVIVGLSLNLTHHFCHQCTDNRILNLSLFYVGLTHPVICSVSAACKLNPQSKHSSVLCRLMQQDWNVP